MIIKKVSVEQVTGIYKSAEDTELSENWKKIKKEAKDEKTTKEELNGSN